MTLSTTANTLHSRRSVDCEAVERDHRATKKTQCESGIKHGRGDHYGQLCGTGMRCGLLIKLFSERPTQ